MLVYAFLLLHLLGGGAQTSQMEISVGKKKSHHSKLSASPGTRAAKPKLGAVNIIMAHAQRQALLEGFNSILLRLSALFYHRKKKV